MGCAKYAGLEHLNVSNKFVDPHLGTLDIVHILLQLPLAAPIGTVSGPLDDDRC